ncbi:BTAD domain-containing putative transcriptional regulator [Actinacidiphila yeochonensis]
MDGVRYSVLGVTEARADTGALVPLGGARVRAVLTVLAAHAGRPVAPDTLIGEVWGGEPPADALGALQALVARLRRALGREAVRSEPGGYRLDVPRAAVDLFAFEALVAAGERELREDRAEAAAATLTRALDLWRGPALADLPEREAPAARAEALRLSAQRLRFEAELRLGRAAALLPALREAAAEHPLDESFHAQLITALRDAGRPADALMAYEQARTVLADTLGADPGPRLRALHAELLRQPDVPPADDRPAASPRPTPTTRAARTRAGAPVPEAPRGNIRARLTSFVGREGDLAAIRSDMAAARLVTLTGPGGSGKTRLAQEAADTMAGAFPDGVWLAELAPLDSPDAIANAVLSALGRRDSVVFGTSRDGLTADPHPDDPVERLVEHCADRALLLVLDNCEHLIAPAAQLAAELLARCPRMTVLATSREPLGVPGEVVRPVEPLPPDTAYRLFAERARTARPGALRGDASGTGRGWGSGSAGPAGPAGPADPATGSGVDAGGHDADTDDEAAAVREICRRLDGLPLAIELAAARLRALSPRQIADRLDDRFRLLTGGSRTLLPRQQTLRAVVDWSWDLLDEPERRTLRALSVFAGGCTLAGAEAVCGPEALDTVVQLVDKSLVVAVHDRAGGTRYRMLETIHEYAAGRAAERPEQRAAAAARHTAYVRELTGTVDPGLRGADQLRWFAVLEAELDNVRAVLQRAVDDGAEDDALAVALAMGWFWWLRGYRDEAAGWMARVSGMAGLQPWERPGHPLYWQRLDLLLLLFFVSNETSDEERWTTSEAAETADRLSAAYRSAGPRAARFPGLMWPFTAYLSAGSAPAAIRGLTDLTVACCREYGGEWELAVALMFRVHVAVDSPGGLDSTEEDWAELQELSGRLGDRWILSQLHGARAEIDVARGRYAEARGHLERSYRLGQELGAFSEGAFVLGRMAELAHREGDDTEAERLLVRADDAAERYAVPDVRTYLRFLSALLRLRRGDLVAARRLYGLAVGHVADGTPPPMFHVMLRGLDARLTAAEGDRVAALAVAVSAVRMAFDVHCTEAVAAAQLDTAAELLVELGDPGGAMRLAGAADTLRGPLPRSRPEQEADRAVREAAVAALSVAEVERERAVGAALDWEAAVRLVTELAEAYEERDGNRAGPGGRPAAGGAPA